MQNLRLNSTSSHRSETTKNEYWLRSDFLLAGELPVRLATAPEAPLVFGKKQALLSEGKDAAPSNHEVIHQSHVDQA